MSQRGKMRWPSATHRAELFCFVGAGASGILKIWLPARELVGIVCEQSVYAVGK